MVNWVQRRGTDRDVERRTQQIKEIVRLGTELRADMGLSSVLTQVVEAVSTALGFQVAVVNLIRPGEPSAEIAATTGLTEQERQRLLDSPPPVSRLYAVMRPEFCISHSYFISHQYKHLLDGVEGVTVYTPQPPNGLRPDAWHPEDVLLVPLLSPRQEGQLLGILSLDQPDDGRVPSAESMEIVELFASQATLAIDTCLLFQEREAERQALESQLFELLYHLEQVRQGNLDVRIELGEQTLRPMAESVTGVLERLSTLLATAREAGEEVVRAASGMRDAAAQLATNAQYQADQILTVSTAVEGMSTSVRTIANIAQRASAEAHDAIEISQEGRSSAERAAEGMSQVREMAIQSVKKMKRLGESSQEIGEIVQMVSDFASQTNLLALNAAIEAARAGENGRGFAIVAQEIRNLANSSAEATKQIHARIKGIQNETNSVVVSIEHSTQQVVLQSELALHAGAALEAVDQATQQLARAIAEMNDTATQQAEAAAIISRSMSGIAEITAQTRDSMDDTRAAMDHLVELAHSLLQSISIFRLRSSAARGPALLPSATLPTSEMSTQPMPAIPGISGIPGMMGLNGVHTLQAATATPPSPPTPLPGVTRGTTTAALPRAMAPLHPSLPPMPFAGTGDNSGSFPVYRPGSQTSRPLATPGSPAQSGPLWGGVEDDANPSSSSPAMERSQRPRTHHGEPGR